MTESIASFIICLLNCDRQFAKNVYNEARDLVMDAVNGNEEAGSELLKRYKQRLKPFTTKDKIDWVRKTYNLNYQQAHACVFANMNYVEQAMNDVSQAKEELDKVLQRIEQKSSFDPKKNPETPTEKAKLAMWFISKFKDVAEAKKVFNHTVIFMEGLE